MSDSLRELAEYATINNGKSIPVYTNKGPSTREIVGRTIDGLPIPRLQSYERFGYADTDGKPMIIELGRVMPPMFVATIANRLLTEAQVAEVKQLEAASGMVRGANRNVPSGRYTSDAVLQRMLADRNPLVDLPTIETYEPRTVDPSKHQGPVWVVRKVLSSTVVEPMFIGPDFKMMRYIADEVGEERWIPAYWVGDYQEMRPDAMFFSTHLDAINHVVKLTEAPCPPQY